MKWIALIVVVLGSIGCASGDPSSAAPAPITISSSAAPTPPRSVEPAPTHTAVIPAAVPLTITAPVEPTPTPIDLPSISTFPACPPLPAPSEVQTPAAVQHFEHGLMFWLQDRAEIWTLIASPLEDQFYWRVLPNLWSESQPESDPNLQPPPGRFQPVRGFGAAWRLGGGSYGPQRDDLGWAIDEEVGFDTTLIYYPQGFYSPDCTWLPKSGIYELRDARGTVYQFVGAGGIAKIVMRKE